MLRRAAARLHPFSSGLLLGEDLGVCPHPPRERRAHRMPALAAGQTAAEDQREQVARLAAQLAREELGRREEWPVLLLRRGGRRSLHEGSSPVRVVSAW